MARALVRTLSLGKLGRVSISGHCWHTAEKAQIRRLTRAADRRAARAGFFRRSPHWSYEFEYFFEIEPKEAFRKQLFGENKLRQVTGEDAAKTKKELFGDPLSGSHRRTLPPTKYGYSKTTRVATSRS